MTWLDVFKQNKIWRTDRQPFVCVMWAARNWISVSETDARERNTSKARLELKLLVNLKLKIILEQESYIFCSKLLVDCLHSFEFILVNTCNYENTEFSRHRGLEIGRDWGLEICRHYFWQGWKFADTLFVVQGFIGPLLIPKALIYSHAVTKNPLL